MINLLCVLLINPLRVWLSMCALCILCVYMCVYTLIQGVNYLFELVVISGYLTCSYGCHWLYLVSTAVYIDFAVIKTMHFTCVSVCFVSQICSRLLNYGIVTVYRSFDVCFEVCSSESTALSYNPNIFTATYAHNHAGSAPGCLALYCINTTGQAQ